LSVAVQLHNAVYTNVTNEDASNLVFRIIRLFLLTALARKQPPVDTHTQLVRSKIWLVAVASGTTQSI